MRTILASILLFLVCSGAYCADGYATYYTVKSCQREGTSGIYTANGERYDENGLTCALPWKPDNKEYLVYGVKSGKWAVLRHNDFGPSKKCIKNGVVIDVTPRAFLEICGNLSMGKCEINYQEVM